MEPDYWILTEGRYFALVDSYTKKLNATLKERYMMGAKKKGATVDLSARDFVEERWQEEVDQVAYSLMEEERVERAKAIL